MRASSSWRAAGVWSPKPTVPRNRTWPKGPKRAAALVELGQRTSPLHRCTSRADTAGVRSADWPCGWQTDRGPRGEWLPPNMQGTSEGCRRIGAERPGARIYACRIPMARLTSPGDPPREHAFGPIMESKPDSTMSDAFRWGEKVTPKATELAACSLLAPSSNIKMAIVKPPPPAPVPTDLGARRHAAVIRSIFPSPVTSPQPTSPEPLAANFSGSAAPTAQERTAQPSFHGHALDRVRVRRSGRVPGANPENTTPRVQEFSAPSAQTQEFQIQQGGAKGGALRDDPRHVQPRGGRRVDQPRGHGGNTVSSWRERRESPSFPRLSK